MQGRTMVDGVSRHLTPDPRSLIAGFAVFVSLSFRVVFGTRRMAFAREEIGPVAQSG